MQPRESIDLQDQSGTALVRAELVSLLARTRGVDLATMYRAMVEMFGFGVERAVSEALGRMIKDGAVQINTIRQGPTSPLVGFVRLVAK